jgi:hypothetical protein
MIMLVYHVTQFLVLMKSVDFYLMWRGLVLHGRVVCVALICEKIYQLSQSLVNNSLNESKLVGPRVIAT